ncbi:hypothetical protein M5K25_019741 [Dendrobium thyrsiflorum]|uniref:Uncharacterized protein n=1 Tax=Dendrobium thyrsiflorum TaxID=117978 RepID=A0ABD0UMJ7_DENTH
MMRKLLEMQSKTSPVVPKTNSNQDLTRIPTAESKGKKIGRKGSDEKSFFHQEPSPRAPIKGGLGFLEGGTAMREFCGGGGKMADHYGRHFGQEEWATEDGGGQTKPWDRVMQEQIEEKVKFPTSLYRGNMEGSRQPLHWRWKKLLGRWLSWQS